MSTRPARGAGSGERGASCVWLLGRPPVPSGGGNKGNGKGNKGKGNKGKGSKGKGKGKGNKGKGKGLTALADDDEASPRRPPKTPFQAPKCAERR